MNSEKISEKKVAGKAVAGKAVAGKVVAGKAVAGVAGKAVAGKAVAGKAGKAVAGVAGVIESTRSRGTSIGEDDYKFNNSCGESIMLLKLYVENSSMKEKYLDAIVTHNEKVNHNRYYDSGFDLFMPGDVEVPYGKMSMLDMGVKCAAYWLTKDDTIGDATGFYMYPRSSLSKTPLRLANSVGIIDSGYRGNLKAAMDCMHGEAKDELMRVARFTRLVQVCSPTLGRMRVVLVYNESDLGFTDRGEGGFGSTGY